VTASVKTGSSSSKLRLHLLGLPNAPVNLDYSLDGFAAATYRFAQMMFHMGHHVILYGAEKSNAPCNEFVQIISERDRTALCKGFEYQHAIMDERYPLWQLSNAIASAEVSSRKQPRDLLLTIGGSSQRPVFQFNPELLDVEWSIGYEGNFCNHRVFESYAHMHKIYGQQNVVDGRFYDTVIPLPFDPDHFKFRPNPEDYFLFVGRLIERKGLCIACQAATAAGVKLKIIGHGGDRRLITGGHEYLGAVDWKTRNEVMSKARAVFTPTIYLEPFNCVAVEAQMCGTPVISTDWGGFTETVEQGVSGFRCSYLKEFVEATKKVETLSRERIAIRAARKYSMWNLCHDYQRYFERLMTRWGAGWNTL
jgi:glycosyltransferase involved in cell wall biosynthesis